MCILYQIVTFPMTLNELGSHFKLLKIFPNPMPWKTRSQAVAKADRILPHSRLSGNYRLLLNGNSSCCRDCTLTKRIGVMSLTFRGPRDVIGHVTIWYPICRFLLVVLWNQASISNGFRDIQWWGECDAIPSCVCVGVETFEILASNISVVRGTHVLVSPLLTESNTADMCVVHSF